MPFEISCFLNCVCIPFLYCVYIWYLANRAIGRQWQKGKCTDGLCRTADSTAAFPLQYQYYFTWFHFYILNTLFLILFLVIHDTREIQVTFVTPCCDICGTEARTPAQRGRSFRRSCSASAKMSSTDSLTSLCPWTTIHISREDHPDLIPSDTDCLCERQTNVKSSHFEIVILILMLISAACYCHKKWNHQNLWTTG